MYFFFFNDTAPTEIYTLSLHDALPISRPDRRSAAPIHRAPVVPGAGPVTRRPAPRLPLVVAARTAARQGLPAIRPAPAGWPGPDRKSTRLNSSHANISYAVFCLKKKKT